MAKQKGIVKLKGSLGDLSLYKSRDGYLAREKGGIDTEMIKNSSRFQRTRENNAEFKEAVRAVNLIQRAFWEILSGVNVQEYRNRLMQEMLKIVSKDSVNVRGKRKVYNEHVESLQGFEFNGHSGFNKLFTAPYLLELLEFDINEWYVNYYTTFAFVPADTILAPAGATHYRIMSAGGQIDFENDSYMIRTKPDLELPLNNDFASFHEAYQIDYEANANLPVFLMLRPVFYQEMNNRLYELKGNSYNAASLVFVKKSVEYAYKVW